MKPRLVAQAFRRAAKRNQAAEEAYVRTLRGIARRVSDRVIALVSGRYDSVASVVKAVVAAAKKEISKAFDRMAAAVVRNLRNAFSVTGIELDAAKLTGFVKRARAENVQLITSASKDYVDGVEAVLKESFGQPWAEVRDKLVERGGVSESRAELIARDQTLKLNGKIIEEQSRRGGLTSYVWSTSNDERVRPEHQDLEGQTFSWDAPPAVGHPGQDFQCRCVAVPILEG